MRSALTLNPEAIDRGARRAKTMGPVMDMFWSDRTGMVVDPADGCGSQDKMAEQMRSQSSG